MHTSHIRALVETARRGRISSSDPHFRAVEIEPELGDELEHHPVRSVEMGKHGGRAVRRVGSKMMSKPRQHPVTHRSVIVHVTWPSK